MIRYSNFANNFKLKALFSFVPFSSEIFTHIGYLVLQLKSYALALEYDDFYIRISDSL